MPKSADGARYSDHINRRVTQTIFRAFDFAAERGTPLNVSVTINLRERSEKASTTAFTDIRHKFRDWMGRLTKKATGKPVPPAYVYALENPNGSVNAHWVLHVPAAYRAEFERKLPRWVRRVQGTCDKYDTKIETVTLGYAKRLAKYIVKGTDPEFVSYFYLDEFDNEQGRIWGKRAGVSAALSKASRNAAGFKPQRRRRIFFPKGRAGQDRRQGGGHWRSHHTASASTRPVAEPPRQPQRPAEAPARGIR